MTDRRSYIAPLSTFTHTLSLHAALPISHASTKCQVRVMIFSPAQIPAATPSLNVAFSPVLQLSASSVTSPVTATLASYVPVEHASNLMSASELDVGLILDFTVIVCT